MDPPLSPSKLVISPGMSVFAVSPDRAAGRTPLYGEPPVMSPSVPNLRASSPLRSPIRSPHRRTDSDVSVQGLATMFEGLEVKDPREASKRYREALEKEKSRNAEKLSKLEKEYAKKEEEHEMAISRRDIRIDELKNKLEQAQGSLEVGVTRAQFEKERKAQKANVAQWEKVFQQNEEKWKSSQAKLQESEFHLKAYELKYKDYKKKCMELNKENLRTTSMIPTLQTKIQGLQRNVQRAESDIRFKTEEAAKYQHQIYSLQVELEGVNAQLGEEIQTLKDKLRLAEGERDALKTSLQEEEVMRIAAEGQIALPIGGTDEGDECESPVRSPRKQRNVIREDDDKENVSPKKGAVELRFLHQELVIEKRLRERAEEQIDFMKMECQFQCCSCRIAENKGKEYVHDDTYAEDMQHIKMSLPVLTPPSSHHGDDAMEGILSKQASMEAARPFTPPSEDIFAPEQEIDRNDHADDNTVIVHPQPTEPDTVVAFSPATGTFRSMPSPVKTSRSVSVTAVTVSTSDSTSPVIDSKTKSSSRTPDQQSTRPNIESGATLAFNKESAVPKQPEEHSIFADPNDNKIADISVREDVLVDSDEEDLEAPTPSHEPSGPATPYLTRTITTTTTIPLHFSPATPAFKPGRGPMTPSTVAHAAANARTPVLGELSLNKLPFDREAALEAIRQRRGRARSMAAGHGTPMKQMVEGVKDRRDISAPVSRVRR